MVQLMSATEETAEPGTEPVSLSCSWGSAQTACDRVWVSCPAPLPAQTDHIHMTGEPRSPRSPLVVWPLGLCPGWGQARGPGVPFLGQGGLSCAHPLPS